MKENTYNAHCGGKREKKTNHYVRTLGLDTWSRFNAISETQAYPRSDSVIHIVSCIRRGHFKYVTFVRSSFHSYDSRVIGGWLEFQKFISRDLALFCISLEVFTPTLRDNSFPLFFSIFENNRLFKYLTIRTGQYLR